MPPKFPQLGDVARDKVTKFTGTVTATAQYLYGDTRALLEPTVQDGKLERPEWFDIDRLELVAVR